MVTDIASGVGQQTLHRDAVATPVHDIAARLQQVLSRRLTAYIAGVKDAKAVTRWARDPQAGIRPQSEQRLRTAYEIVRLFQACQESDQTVRAWFLGLNPQLDDTAPAEALNAGQLREVLMAARAFVAGAY